MLSSCQFSVRVPHCCFCSPFLCAFLVCSHLRFSSTIFCVFCALFIPSCICSNDLWFLFYCLMTRRRRGLLVLSSGLFFSPSRLTVAERLADGLFPLAVSEFLPASLPRDHFFFFLFESRPRLFGVAEVLRLYLFCLVHCLVRSGAR